jgi:hypothetical protein
VIRFIVNSDSRRSTEYVDRTRSHNPENHKRSLKIYSRGTQSYYSVYDVLKVCDSALVMKQILCWTLYLTNVSENGPISAIRHKAGRILWS